MDRSTISIANFCAALYCAETRWEAFATAPTGRIVFTARTLDTGQENYYRVEFDNVRDYSCQNETSRGWEPGDRLELSIVELEGEPGAWRVWFNPWYLHEIQFWCTRIRVNGAEVVGRGKHVQDWLPDRVPDVPPYTPGAA